ncbi:hypothetical protein, partial [Mesorhizobium sp. M4B.F.Ca.ET.214.01.1.1]|uniref:hypothetical protein n=1 Tax=Mesorhizobium sp. M4B.F.Ca.ET.214.01.1.1 TaxID=2563955 RepID=UPI001AEE15C3
MDKASTRSDALGLVADGVASGDGEFSAFVWLDPDALAAGGSPAGCAGFWLSAAFGAGVGVSVDGFAGPVSVGCGVSARLLASTSGCAAVVFWISA